MILQTQKDDNCLAYAAAMVLGIDAETLLRLVGHRGQHKAWPTLPGSHAKVGIHIQEIQDAFRIHGYVLAEVQIAPCVLPRAMGNHPPHVLWDDTSCERRFLAWITGREAILTGLLPHGLGHAVAWDGKIIYDPKGHMCGIHETDLQIQSAWIKCKLI